MKTSNTKKSNKIKFNSILGGGKIAGLMNPVMDRVLKLKRIRKFYERAGLENLSGLEFVDRVIEKAGIKYNVDMEQLNNIPQDGPVIIVSNHPYGFIDGLIMLQILSHVRADYKVMVNGMISKFDELDELFIPVDNFNVGSKGNMGPMRNCIRHLKKDGILGVFPSGSVSNFSFKKRNVTDDEWSETVAGLARITGATVVPMHFSGHNSLRFQLAGLIHPLLRTAMLPAEACRQIHNKIEVSIGQLVSPQTIKGLDNDREIADYLRVCTYLLKEENNSEIMEPSSDGEEIIQAIERDTLEREIAELPKSQHLVEFKDFDVYYASYGQIPNMMLEIGRTREETFRAVGEGTGKSMDIDKYDVDYLQIFIWDRKNRGLVGAYRMGLVDELIKKHGIDGLYTNLFYEFSPEFLEKVENGMEMGRSYVCKEYQRSPYALLLLWKGIAEFSYKHPERHMMFGAVSVSGEYDIRSRRLIKEILSHRDSGVMTRKEYRLPGKADREIKEFCRSHKDDFDSLVKLVKRVEDDDKSVPVLYKQYLKLGGEFTAFCYDEGFNGSMDGLILVDLAKTPEKVLKMYLGDKTQEYKARYGQIAS